MFVDAFWLPKLNIKHQSNWHAVQSQGCPYTQQDALNLKIYNTCPYEAFIGAYSRFQLGSGSCELFLLRLEKYQVFLQIQYSFERT